MARYQVTVHSMMVSSVPGSSPATKSAPIEVLVDTAYDFRDRRQHQYAEGTGDRDDAGAEAHRIAVAHHLGQHDGADGRHRGDARPADQGEHRAGNDSGKPQTAAPMAD